MRLPLIGCFLKRQKLMKSLASLITLVLMWLWIYPVTAAAQIQAYRVSRTPVMPTQDAGQKAVTLQAIEQRLAAMQVCTHQADDTEVEMSELHVLRQRLDQADQHVHQQFHQVKQYLDTHGRPKQLITRHADVVARYEADMKTLRGHLDTIEAAPTSAERHALCQLALGDLRSTHGATPHRTFDPGRLPFRVAAANVREPKATRQAFRHWLGLTNPVNVSATTLPTGLLATSPFYPDPTPEDLAATEDVQLTEDIRALAAELDNQPVAIYNWVHDHIDFAPTYGSVQGAQLTLETQRGNAFDISSLLIALLRAANIPARYSIGTVEIPMAQAMNWVGASTPEATLDVLAQGGIPSQAVVAGGTIRSVRIEHVWVEAWVDFEPSFGAIHLEGDTWVPMDGTFKSYTETPGIDVLAVAPFDAQDLIDELTHNATIHADGAAPSAASMSIRSESPGPITKTLLSRPWTPWTQTRQSKRCSAIAKSWPAAAPTSPPPHLIRW